MIRVSDVREHPSIADLDSDSQQYLGEIDNDVLRLLTGYRGWVRRGWGRFLCQGCQIPLVISHNTGRTDRAY